MSILRELVAEADKLRTQRVTLNEGKRPSFFTIRGAVVPKKFNPLTSADMDYLFSSIFTQAGDLLRHQRHARKFKILELGEVDCIGLTDLRQINIYLARGAELYALDYAKFFSTSAATGEEEQAADGAEQVDEQGGGSKFNATNNKMIDAMISFADEPDASQKDAKESAKPSSNLPPPALPQSSKPDSAGDGAFHIDIPSLHDNPVSASPPATTAPKGETQPEKGGTGVFPSTAQSESQPEGSEDVFIFYHSQDQGRSRRCTTCGCQCCATEPQRRRSGTRGSRCAYGYE